MNKRGLGKGLDAFFSETVAAEPNGILQIKICEIKANPFQPRRNFDREKLDELAQSIRQHGVLQPVVVRTAAQGYELAAGERRWRAATLAELTEIPAVVKNYTDEEMTTIALIENLQRQDLNPVEEAMAFQSLMQQFSLTQEEVAARVGRSRSHVANILRLLKLPSQVLDDVARGTITMGHAKPLLALENAEQQVQTAALIMEKGLSVRDVEEYVRRILKRPTPETKKEMQKSIYVTAIEDRLKSLLGTQVRVKEGKMRSKIEIEYYGEEDLERILQALEHTEEPVSAVSSTLAV